MKNPIVNLKYENGSKIKLEVNDVDICDKAVVFYKGLYFIYQSICRNEINGVNYQQVKAPCDITSAKIIQKLDD